MGTAVRCMYALLNVAMYCILVVKSDDYNPKYSLCLFMY